MTKDELIELINHTVYENEDGDITGEVMNLVLNAIVATIGVEANPDDEATGTLTKIKIGEEVFDVEGGGVELPDGALYGGFVRPDEPPTYGDDYRYYYLAEENGEYIYFNRLYVDSNVSMFYYDTESEVWRQKVLWIKNVVLDGMLWYKAGKPVSSTQGHIPNLDQYGDLEDSGIAVSDVATTSDLAGKQDVISDLAAIRSGAAAGATAYQKPSGGIPKTDLASGVQTSLGKADTAVQQVTVGTTTTGNAGTNASVTNSGTETNPVLNFTIPRGADGQDGQDGADAVNPFKGWYASANALPANPVVGDYAYVKGANASDPAAIYECTTAGTWSDSGGTADTSNVQTFASSQEVNEVHIVNDLTTGGTEDVLSAEQGKDVNGRLTSVEISVNGKVPSEDEAIDLTQYSAVTATIYNGAWLVNQSYQGKFIPCVPNRQYKFVGNNSYTSFFAFLKDDGHTAGSQVQFAEGYSGAVNVLAGEEATYTAPTDATFLYVSTKYSNNNNEFSSVTLIGEEGVVGLVSRVEGVKRTIYGVSTDDEEIDISQYAEQQNFINFTEYFINQYYKGRFIPCVAGAKYRFKANSEYTSIVAFLHSIDNVSSGVTPDFAEGWEITLNVLAGEEVVLFAPNDATYIWCASLNGALQPCDFQKIEQLGEEIQKGLADLSILPQTSMRYPQKELPVISFVFDDIDENDSDVVRLFDYYGLKCGFAYIASEAKIEEHKDKYLEWQRRGYSILNHSVDGKKFDSTNYPTIASAYYAIMTAKQRLEAAGFVINGFVAPSSEFLSDYIDALRNTHQYAYTTADLANTRSSNPCNISRLSLQTTKLADILGDATNQQSIAFYLAANRQLTFYGHSADFGNIYGGEVFSIDKIRQVVERCISLRNEGRCVILSPDNMADYFFRGQQIILSNTSDNRPLSPCEGMMFFDKTIGKPIWYNGVNWVDSNGTTV